jgi:hypothetical protein
MPIKSVSVASLLFFFRHSVGIFLSTRRQKLVLLLLGLRVRMRLRRGGKETIRVKKK